MCQTRRTIGCAEAIPAYFRYGTAKFPRSDSGALVTMFGTDEAPKLAEEIKRFLGQLAALYYGASSNHGRQRRSVFGRRSNRQRRRIGGHFTSVRHWRKWGGTAAAVIAAVTATSCAEHSAREPSRDLPSTSSTPARLSTTHPVAAAVTRPACPDWTPTRTQLAEATQAITLGTTANGDRITSASWIACTRGVYTSVAGDGYPTNRADYNARVIVVVLRGRFNMNGISLPQGASTPGPAHEKDFAFDPAVHRVTDVGFGSTEQDLARLGPAHPVTS